MSIGLSMSWREILAKSDSVVSLRSMVPRHALAHCWKSKFTHRVLLHDGDCSTENHDTVLCRRCECLRSKTLACHEQLPV